jgi:hypothetical protein
MPKIIFLALFVTNLMGCTMNPSEPYIGSAKDHPEVPEKNYCQNCYGHDNRNGF